MRGTNVYRYRVAGIAKVIDGDTFDLDLDLGFYVNLRIRVRLADVDAYEVYGRNAHPLGSEAKNLSERWLAQALEDGLTIETFKLNLDSPVPDGSFGRWAGRLTNDVTGEDLAVVLTDAGYVK